MTTDELTRRAKELCEKASPGPWYSHEGGVTAGKLVHGVGEVSLGRFCTSDDDAFFKSQDVKNGHFTAESRTLLPLLVDEVERLREELETLELDSLAERGLVGE